MENSFCRDFTEKNYHNLAHEKKAISNLETFSFTILARKFPKIEFQLVGS